MLVPSTAQIYAPTVLLVTIRALYSSAVIFVQIINYCIWIQINKTWLKWITYSEHNMIFLLNIQSCTVLGLPVLNVWYYTIQCPSTFCSVNKNALCWHSSFIVFDLGSMLCCWCTEITRYMNKKLFTPDYIFWKVIALNY